MDKRIVEISIYNKSIFLDLNFIYAISDVESHIYGNYNGVLSGHIIKLGTIVPFTDKDEFIIYIPLSDDVQFLYIEKETEEKRNLFYAKAKSLHKELVDIWMGKSSVNKIILE